MTTLRVCAYNLCFGGSDRLDAIHAVLAHANADLIALTEADDRAVVETLANRLNVHYVWAKGSGARHIAALSRYPIDAWRVYNTPPLTQAVLVTTIDAPRPMTAYNIHLLPYLLLPFEFRRWQAVGRLLEVIRTRPPEPHLVLGDLNAIAPGDRVLQRHNPPRMRRVMMLQLRLIFRLAIPRLLGAGYVDCFRRMNPREDGFTWMTGNRTTRYDYIFADPTLAPALRACCVVDGVDAVNAASDHFPVLAEFDLSASWSVKRTPHD